MKRLMLDSTWRGWAMAWARASRPTRSSPAA
ncbi:hypothetical protein PPSIR1_41139 [Plesiocystis pacifica SIR-1]|uniref:Uncharacterized protein n=1 Tax=Plesiocystis pacifica SIR-1 TaxID=391625 RepID=A6GIQ9_9BACT|nr:hypothetical protein PPSIR1_41139 [Plesiocystis pacifica SIR-1]